MKPSHRSLLLHPLFLIIVFANDNWWKYTYPGWLTGKLSDVAGIFIFLVFLNVLMPGKKWVTTIFTILFFTWWKSSLSDPFIHWMNSSLHLPVQRTIDYTDLLALLVIPIALRLQPYQYKTALLNRVIKPVAFLFCITVICATSMYRYPAYITPANEFKLDKNYYTRLTEEQILHKLDSLNIAYVKDSVEMYPAATGGFYLKVDHGKDSAAEWIPVDEMKNPQLYYKYTTTAYYKVPVLALEKDTINNIKFRINTEGKRQRSIQLISMQLPGQINYGYYMQPRVFKKYRAIIHSILTN
jgi:hypothetical protein